ncbi:MAG: YMGG-like glycine zipper-containing protein [Verrucomicrobiota bacterium]|jgi:surface antigen
MNVKNYTLIVTLAGMAVLLSGCVNPDGTPNNTGSGALIGGAMGALTGAAIGGRGHAGPDALIGAAAGALAGGLIGNTADREQDARLSAQAPRAYVPVAPGRPTSVPDVEAMAKAGVSDDVIINQITNTRTVYHLAATDVIGLRQAGVSDKVLNFMINTPSLWAVR